MVTAVLGFVAIACRGEPEGRGEDAAVVDDAASDAGARDDEDASSDAGAASDGGGGEPVVGLVSVDLGEVSAGETFVLDVPRGTLGFNLVAEGAPGDVIAFDVSSPTGEPIFLDYVPENAGPFGGVAAVSVPQNDRALALDSFEGEWEVTLQAPSPLHVTAQMQVTRDGRFHGGTLDLHLYVADGLIIQDPTSAHDVSADEAAEDEAIQARVDAFFDLLESLYDVGRGEVQYHAIDDRLRIITSPEELLELFSATAIVPDGQAMHIMLTNEIADIGLPTAGVSAGVPGAATRTGTPLSAVAVAVSDFIPAPLAGLIMAHETSHFLGLTHTSELDGRFDPLDDTVQCPDISMDHLDDCPDAANLLFPTPMSDEPTVTESQRAIVQASPLIRSSP